jgi:hypothetical protein
VYVYYEQHRDAAGATVLLELRLSSYSDGRLAIAFSTNLEKVLFDLCKTTLKEPPIGLRSYDDSTKCWSYLGNCGVAVLDRLRQITAAMGHEVQCVEVEDLTSQAANNRIDLSGKRARAPRPEDFFYQQSAPAKTPALTKETVAAKLSDLMGPVLDKRAYRQAALRYHPDRNNGDGSKMSELNMLWSVYNG